MALYKLRVPNRQDASFGVVNAYTLTDEPIPVGFNPFHNKMFNKVYNYLFSVLFYPSFETTAFKSTDTMFGFIKTFDFNFF